MDLLSPVKEYGGCMLGGVVLAVSSIAAVVSSPNTKSKVANKKRNSMGEPRVVDVSPLICDNYNNNFDKIIENKDGCMILYPRVSHHYQRLKASLADINITVDDSRDDYATLDLSFLLKHDESFVYERKLFHDLQQYGKLLLGPGEAFGHPKPGIFRLVCVHLDDDQANAIKSGLARVIEFYQSEEESEPVRKQLKQNE